MICVLAQALGHNWKLRYNKQNDSPLLKRKLKELRHDIWVISSTA